MPFYKNKAKKNKANKGAPSEGPVRVKLPKGKEVLGVVEQRYGGGKMLVRCLDGKSRNCRIPGRLKRKLWIREGDIVIIVPWELNNERGDVLFKYNPAAVSFLRKKGYLKDISEF